LFLFVLVFKVSAWDKDNIESVKEYVIYTAQKEKIPVGEAMIIAKCESGYKKNSVNDKGEYSVGIFQINLKYHDLTLEEARNPFTNINYAMELYWREDKKGEPLRWSPWKNCAKKHGIL